MSIEITSHCNFKCDFCPSETLDREKGHLSVADIGNIVRDLYQNHYVAPFEINLLGEPTLHPDFFQCLDILAHYGYEVYLVTNGWFFRKSDFLPRLTAYPNVRHVGFSFHTPTAAAFPHRGAGGISFDDYIEALYAAVKHRIETGWPENLNIYLLGSSMIDDTLVCEDGAPLFRYFNKAELRGFLSAFHQRIRAMCPVDSRFIDAVLAAYENKDGAMIHVVPGVRFHVKPLGLWSSSMRFLREQVFPDKFVYIEERTGRGVCPQTCRLVINSGGTISGCCHDVESEMSSLSIWDTPLDSEALATFLRQSQENALIHSVCRRCQGIKYVFDTHLDAQKADVVLFSPQCREVEGKRVLKGAESAYIYPKRPCSAIAMALESQCAAAYMGVVVAALNPDRGSFEPVANARILANGPGVVDCDMVPGTLYRVTFTPETNDPILIKVRLTQ